MLTRSSWLKLSVVKGQTGAVTRDSGLSSVTGEPYGVLAVGPQTSCWATLGSSDGTSESSWCFRTWGRAGSCQTALKLIIKRSSPPVLDHHRKQLSDPPPAVRLRVCTKTLLAPAGGTGARQTDGEHQSSYKLRSQRPHFSKN